jgi:Cu/Ag efflux protein CusF
MREGIRQGTNSRLAACRLRFENREVSMKLANTILAGALLAVIPALAWAQQPLTGTIVTIDRISGTIGIQQQQSGTVGAGGGGATEQQYKAPDGVLDKLHAGDKVTFSASEIGGKKTITKIESK